VTLTFADGTKYVGEFRDNQIDGHGRETWPDGKKYVGEFRDGKLNGQATLTSADGTKHVGVFRDGWANARDGEHSLTRVEYNTPASSKAASLGAASQFRQKHEWNY
jgi:hypothetical protein